MKACCELNASCSCCIFIFIVSPVGKDAIAIDIDGIKPVGKKDDAIEAMVDRVGSMLANDDDAAADDMDRITLRKDAIDMERNEQIMMTRFVSFYVGGCGEPSRSEHIYMHCTSRSGPVRHGYGTGSDRSPTPQRIVRCYR